MEKIKPRITNWLQSEKGKDILTVLIVILVGVGCFELGRLSKESSTEGIKIEYPNQNQNYGENLIQDTNQSANVIFAKDTVSADKNYFASNRGKKYYPLGCSAGKTIKRENRVYFATSEEAEKAGYTLSSSCN